MDTDEQQLAYVAFEILEALVISVQTERSFSKSRYVINQQKDSSEAIDSIIKDLKAVKPFMNVVITRDIPFHR